MRAVSNFHGLRLACLAAGASLGLAAEARAQDPVSFAGKAITVTVGFEAGNRVDLYARTLMTRMRQHLPGQPGTVILNRPGAGGVISLNDWSIKSSADGLQLAIGGQTQIDGDALARTHAKYDPAKFRYVGGLVAPSQGLFIAKPVLETIHDKNAKPVTMGMVGTTLRTGYYQALWGTAFLGWNVKWVSGYKSTAEARTALERGEVDMSAFGTGTDIDYLLATGSMAVLSQSGAIIDGKMSARPVFGSTPVIADLVKGKIKDPLAQKAFDYSEKVIQVGMWVALPPGASDAILSAYVKAFEETINDPRYREEWAKIDPDSPVARKAELERLVKDLATVSPEALDFIQDELKRQSS